MMEDWFLHFRFRIYRAKSMLTTKIMCAIHEAGPFANSIPIIESYTSNTIHLQNPINPMRIEVWPTIEHRIRPPNRTMTHFQPHCG